MYTCLPELFLNPCLSHFYFCSSSLGSATHSGVSILPCLFPSLSSRLALVTIQCRTPHDLVEPTCYLPVRSPADGRTLLPDPWVKRKKPQCPLQGSTFPFPQALIGEGDGTPPQYSCLENPVDGGAWWAAVHGVTKSQTRLSDFTFTFHFHALEREMATHSSVLAWRIPGTGEPGGLPSMGSHRVGHDWSDLAAAERQPVITVFCWFCLWGGSFLGFPPGPCAVVSLHFNLLASMITLLQNHPNGLVHLLTSESQTHRDMPDTCSPNTSVSLLIPKSIQGNFYKNA